jgi:hypothetical protein
MAVYRTRTSFIVNTAILSTPQDDTRTVGRSASSEDSLAMGHTAALYHAAAVYDAVTRHQSRRSQQGCSHQAEGQTFCRFHVRSFVVFLLSHPLYAGATGNIPSFQKIF